MLKEMLIKDDLICIQEEVKDWKEAVIKGVALLTRADVVEPRYCDAILSSTEKVGPYYVICPGVAMPHSRPEDGVKRNGVSIMTLKTPVFFGNVENDPVRIIISLAATDNVSHLDMMKEIAELFSSQEAIDQLQSATTTEVALEVFK